MMSQIKVSVSNKVSEKFTRYQELIDKHEESIEKHEESMEHHGKLMRDHRLCIIRIREIRDHEDVLNCLRTCLSKVKASCSAYLRLSEYDINRVIETQEAYLEILDKDLGSLVESPETSDEDTKEEN